MIATTFAAPAAIVGTRPALRELLPDMREELARTAARGNSCPILYILEVASGEYALAMLAATADQDENLAARS